MCCLIRCKAEPSQLLKTEFGEFNVDNRCWMRTGCSLTQVCAGVLFDKGVGQIKQKDRRLAAGCQSAHI